jgi:glycosyltransferase involved in cell wall biosynthesis
MKKVLSQSKHLCWLTADYFLDCDVEIIKNLSNYYYIHWHIILPIKNSRYTRSEINQWESPNVEINIHWNKYRLRNPVSFVFFFRLIKQIKKISYEILYLNYTPSPFFTFATILFLKRNNVIVTAHQGKVHEGFKFKFIYWFSYSLFYSYFPFVNLFSDSETAKFCKVYPKSTVFTIPLALKNFGECKVSQSQDSVEFFNFGTIRASKNIMLLIEAACSLYEEGVPKFRITIAGECENWEVYKNKIKYPQIFNIIIRKIENQEINELFCRYHYLVLPYSTVTQSGPLKIAYYYNVPVIASNLPGFSNDILDGETGFLFEPGNVHDLKRVMLKAINNYRKEYQFMKQKLAEYVDKEYSGQKILKKYISMFEVITSLQLNDDQLQ